MKTLVLLVIKKNGVDLLLRLALHDKHAAADMLTENYASGINMTRHSLHVQHPSQQAQLSISPCHDITEFTVVDSIACLTSHLAGAWLVTVLTQVVGPVWLLATNKAHRLTQGEIECINAYLL